jgi:hypothetical protein
LNNFKFTGEEFDSSGEYVGRELQSSTPYVLLLGVGNNKILSFTKCLPGARPLPSEFWTYMNDVIAHLLFPLFH